MTFGRSVGRPVGWSAVVLCIYICISVDVCIYIYIYQYIYIDIYIYIYMCVCVFSYQFIFSWSVYRRGGLLLSRKQALFICVWYVLYRLWRRCEITTCGMRCADLVAILRIMAYNITVMVYSRRTKMIFQIILLYCK